MPVEIARLEFISMDPPKHDRIKALFLSGFRAERIAAHEPWMEITGEAPMVESFFLDQHKTLPVRLGPRAS
ncbi:hypothetical protein ABTY53_11120 [Streptomyces noursei]|uniref:hypothetical protein n=1 Tax=Streptomyces noursei TaxID=1971 RepID=UPI0033225DA2